ncbi:MAG: alpha/beta fold hydrolase [Gilvibacter sp.]
MPLIESTYKAPSLFLNRHVATVYSAKLRRAPSVRYTRERFTTPDNDFVDLDWLMANAPSNRIAVMLHGLEGNSNRTYMRGCAHYLSSHGWNVVAVNFRGCSGMPNLNYKSYNAGITDDLDAIVRYIDGMKQFKEIALVGFSLGGNLLLKYLGEGRTLVSSVSKGVAVSAPLDLKGSLARLSESQNWLYRTKFLLDLKKKLKDKWRRFPEMQGAITLSQINSLLDFDNAYTAPAHGFEDAYDYYAKSSSLFYLEKIAHPVLILNAKNDSFLSPNCFPSNIAEQSSNIYLESPDHGGHVAFISRQAAYYNEQSTLTFLNERR